MKKLLICFFIFSMGSVMTINTFASDKNSTEKKRVLNVFKLDIKSSSQYLLELFSYQDKYYYSSVTRNITNIPVTKIYKLYPPTTDVFGKYRRFYFIGYYKLILKTLTQELGMKHAWRKMKKEDKLEPIAPENAGILVEVNEKLKYTKYSIPWYKINESVVYYNIILTDNLSFFTKLLSEDDQKHFKTIDTFAIPDYKRNPKTGKIERVKSEEQK